MLADPLDQVLFEPEDAFDWDNDHLYAFFLSGRAWDPVTEIGAPSESGEPPPPTADEVYLSELGLEPRQSFLYVFDFGDQLCHEIEFLGSAPVSGGGEYPCAVETHGKAPPQYPCADEDDWDDEPS